MADAASTAAPSPALRWDTLQTGSDLWATVEMAAGFVLPEGQTVREHYRIAKPLGQGGMGQVLGVTLMGTADQQTFALKMIARPAQDAGKPMDPADRRAAELQAKVFATLLHGEAAKQELVQRHGVSVARLFALVRFEDGSLGLRMEIARGRSLEAFIEEEAKHRKAQTPDLDFCLVVMRKVLYQLRRLHELVDPSSPTGFVHSDIKPGNVFVDEGDRYDPFITLLDFGVATAGHALDVDRASRFAGRKSLVLNDAGGTFGYAPPHHFTGRPTPLSDVYAALVILYELIALRSPWDFSGLAKTAANLFKLEDAMRRGPRPVRSARDSIPEDTAAVLDRFFAEEFKALHDLADAAHAARGSGDPATRKAMNERLRTLAQGYQGKLDALRVSLGGAPAPGGSSPAIRIPAPDPVLASDGPSRVGSKPSPMPPVVPAVARNSDTPAATSRSVREYEADDDDEPIRVPMRRSLLARLFVLAVVVGGGVAGVAYWRGGESRAELERAAREAANRANLPELLERVRNAVNGDASIETLSGGDPVQQGASTTPPGANTPTPTALAAARDAGGPSALAAVTADAGGAQATAVNPPVATPDAGATPAGASTANDEHKADAGAAAEIALNEPEAVADAGGAQVPELAARADAGETAGPDPGGVAENDIADAGVAPRNDPGLGQRAGQGAQVRADAGVAARGVPNVAPSVVRPVQQQASAAHLRPPVRPVVRAQPVRRPVVHPRAPVRRHAAPAHHRPARHPVRRTRR